MQKHMYHMDLGIQDCHRKVKEDRETRSRNGQDEGHRNDPVCFWHKKVNKRKIGWNKVPVLCKTTNLAQRDAVFLSSLRIWIKSGYNLNSCQKYFMAP